MQGLPSLNFNAGDITRGVSAGVRASESKTRRNLMDERNTREQGSYDTAQAGIKAQRMISILKAGSAEEAAILNSVHNPGTRIKWQGENVEMRNADGTIVSGPKSHLITMQKMIMAGGDPKDAYQYAVDNGVLISNPQQEAEQAKTLEGLLAQSINELPPEQRTPENIMAMMGQIEAMGSNDQTALQKDLIAAGMKPGSPEFQQAILESRKKPGMRLETGADGSVSFVSGQGVDLNRITPTKPTENKIQEKLFNSYEAAARLDKMATGFKPEFLTIPEKAGHKWTELKEKFNMGDVSDSDRKDLAEFTEFRQDSLENINLFIKEITGAQMSEKEAKRIRKALPDPGEGVLDGDSPTEYRTNLINAIIKTKSAIARYHIMLQNGLDENSIKKAINGGMAIPLDQVEKMMEARFDEYLNDPKFKGKDISVVAKAVASEFGLVQ
jgi:hypothetical protein